MRKRLAGSYFAAFSANRITIGFQNPQKILKICSHPVTFSQRFFKPDRLLGRKNNFAAVVLFLVENLIGSGRLSKGHTVADNDVGV